MWMPTSFSRWLTKNAITPYTPMDARIRARPARNIADKVKVRAIRVCAFTPLSSKLSSENAGRSRPSICSSVERIAPIASRGSPEIRSKAMGAIRSTLEQIDGRLRPAFSLLSLEDSGVKAQTLMARTFTLSAMFLAGLALILASIGVYGVMAFLVSQREKEVGIHMALGATRQNVLLLMLRQGMRPVIFGGVLGMVGALSVSGFMRALLIFPGSVDVLYGARWFDPLTFVGLSLLLVLIALLACYIPARRATQVDPLVALRHE